MMHNLLHVSLIQTTIEWENSKVNISRIYPLLQQLSGTTDLAILPELFTTGLTMKTEENAESMNGSTIATLKNCARTFKMAITGSFLVKEKEQFYNRAFFVTPEGFDYFYDKRHLFRMAKEDQYYKPGQNRLIIEYKGWKICPLICYDLRFPVWSRNKNNEYDLLIYVANWPEARKHAWETLLCARAIENQAYVCGVNRIGTDGKGFVYHGQSLIFSPEGQKLVNAGEYIENICTYSLNIEKLNDYRTRFPVWKDTDSFSID